MNTTWTVVGSNPVQAWIIFRPYFHHCSSSVHYCEDHFHIHVFIRSSNIWLSYIHSRLFTTSRVYLEPNDNQLQVDLLAQLVEHCTGIAEVMGSNPVQAWIFFRPYFRYCSNSVHYCEHRFHIHITRIVMQIVRRITNVILGDTGTREFHMAINWTER